MSFEQVIFGNLILREEYGRKVIPFLKQEYFENGGDRIIFELINNYVQKYNNFPTQEALNIELSNKEHVDQNVFTSASQSISQLDFEPDTSIEWLVDQTEKFCQEKAIYNGIRQSIQIIDGSSEKTLSKGSIPQILSDALAVSFDSNIGHNWIDDSDSRYDFYHRKEVRVAFDLSYLNKITDDGLPNKTLNVILAGCVHPDTLIKIRYR